MNPLEVQSSWSNICREEHTWVWLVELLEGSFTLTVIDWAVKLKNFVIEKEEFLFLLLAVPELEPVYVC